MLLLLAACGSAETDPEGTAADEPSATASATSSAASSGPKLKVVTTVAPITSITAAVAGDRAEIRGLVPEGTNSHTFEPPPSAAEVLEEADLVFINGLKLEDPTLKLAQANMADGAKLVEIGTAVLPESDYLYDFSFPKEEGKPNPHLWTDPTYAIKYAEEIRKALTDAGRGGRRRLPGELRHVRRPGHRPLGRAEGRPGNDFRPARAADLPRRVRVLREDVRLEGRRRDPAGELRGPDTERDRAT